MFDKLRQLGELKKMRDQAVQIQHQLASQKIEVEEQGIKVVMTGDQRIEVLEIDGVSQPKLKDILNKATKQSQTVAQQLAAEKLKEMGGGGLGGLLG